MIQVSLDISFLISFADPDRKHHAIAVDYFRHCLANRIPMWISVVAAGEFEVGQPVSDLPLQNFRILPYNLLHASLRVSLSPSAVICVICGYSWRFGVIPPSAV